MSCSIWTSWATCISTGWEAAAATTWTCWRITSNPLHAMHVPWCWQRQSCDLSLSSSEWIPLRSTPEGGVSAMT